MYYGVFSLVRFREKNMLWAEHRKTLGSFEKKVAMLSRPEFPRSLKK